MTRSPHAAFGPTTYLLVWGLVGFFLAPSDLPAQNCLGLHSGADAAHLQVGVYRQGRSNGIVFQVFANIADRFAAGAGIGSGRPYPGLPEAQAWRGTLVVGLPRLSGRFCALAETNEVIQEGRRIDPEEGLIREERIERMARVGIVTGRFLGRWAGLGWSWHVAPTGILRYAMQGVRDIEPEGPKVVLDRRDAWSFHLGLMGQVVARREAWSVMVGARTVPAPGTDLVSFLHFAFSI